MIKYFPVLKNINPANIITSLSLLIGFVCTILLLQNYVKIALLLYPITFLFDRLDGTIARSFNCQSEFGKQLDSLSDFFNFCFLPVFITYILGFKSILMLFFLAIYFLAGFWRLAYYNLVGLENKDDKLYFHGLPSTDVAAWFYIFITIYIYILNIKVDYYICLFFLIGSIIMISSLKFSKNSFFTNIFFLLIPLSMGLIVLRK